MNSTNLARMSPGIGYTHPEAFWFAVMAFVVIALVAWTPESTKRKISRWTEALLGFLIISYFVTMLLQILYGLWQDFLH